MVQDTRGLLRAGDEFAKDGNIAKAVECYEIAGDAFLSVESPLKAIALFKMILEFDPTRIEMNAKLAAAHALLGLPGDGGG